MTPRAQSMRGVTLRYIAAALLLALVGMVLTLGSSERKWDKQFAPQHDLVLQKAPAASPARSESALRFLERVPTTGLADDDHSLEEKQKLIARVRRIAELCLDLCDTTRPLIETPLRLLNGTETGKVFDKTVAPVQCSALVSNTDLDASLESAKPPKNVPAELRSEFTIQDRVPISTKHYLVHNYFERSAPPVWSQKFIMHYREMAKAGTLAGSYNVDTTNAMRAALDKIPVPGSRALVVGSERPWIESLLLNRDAREVLTLEYGKIRSEVPNLITMQPREFASKYASGELELFDLVFTFSSLEHSGLGRYGDALNPWGDILSVAKMWCVTKPGGLLVLMVPVSATDVLHMNAHRLYGPLRTPYLMTNWDRIQFEGTEPGFNIKLFKKPLE
eukprot:CAMPEP_0185834130 /NCGR_PEP_ID=MMETSP1353-20130828/4468_1 /TAXON_ID=1077150 /ORGANISM="Erythrolobus australicus, Strain CCMP3124" /LENGTH=390 /DNA_ID=CAMNT_0028532507 /DNA_START=96 /DNA_END=1268 /DNA_ORIENTATION=+